MARFSLPHKFIKDMAVRLNFKALEDFINDTIVVNVRGTAKEVAADPANLPPVAEYAGEAIADAATTAKSEAITAAVTAANGYTDTVDIATDRLVAGSALIGSALIGSVDAATVNAGTLTGIKVQTAASGARVILLTDTDSGIIYIYGADGALSGVIDGSTSSLPRLRLQGKDETAVLAQGLVGEVDTIGGLYVTPASVDSTAALVAGSYLHAKGDGEVGGIRIEDANGVVYALYAGTNGKLYIKPAGGTAVVVGTQS